MQMIKKENGVTMMMLVITIIVLTIVASIVVNYTINGMEYSTEKSDLAELETVQHAIYEQYEQYKTVGDGDFLIGTEASETDKQKLTSNGGTWKSTGSSDEADKYLKLTKEQLKEIGIEDAKSEYIINYKTGECFNITKIKTELNDTLLYID